MYTTLESVTDTIGHDEMLALVDAWAHVLSHQIEGEGL